MQLLEEGLQQTLILLLLRTTGQVQVHCLKEPHPRSESSLELFGKDTILFGKDTILTATRCLCITASPH